MRVSGLELTEISEIEGSLMAWRGLEIKKIKPTG